MPVFAASNISNKTGSLELVLQCSELVMPITNKHQLTSFLKAPWFPQLVCILKIKLFTNGVFIPKMQQIYYIII